MARRGLATSGFALGKTVQVLLLAAIAVGLMASGAWASGRVALVVGNGSYATLGTLANPTNDAEDIAATLRGMGFQVTVADNADERGFTELLSNFATAATDADVALFYYSGHGLQYRSENYLVPVDATLENRFSLTHETIPLADILAATSGAHTTLIYIDACRSFPIAGTFLAAANERVTPARGLAPVDNVTSTFIGFSASAGETARDGTGRNSPFTSAMLEELPTPGMDVTEMFNAVSAKVVSSTDGAQKPQSFDGISQDVTLVAEAPQGAAAAGTGTDDGQKAYDDASAIGTIGAYRAYIAHYPGGFYSELAREALSKLEAASDAASASSSEQVADIPPAQPTPPPFQLPTTLPQSLKEANLSYFGSSKETIGSWRISQSNGRCHMVTEALGLTPDGWLSARPWLYFSTAKNGNLVWGSMITANQDDGSDVFQPGTAVAAVVDTDGSTHQVPAVFEGSELQMLSKCDTSNDSYCVDSDGVGQLMAGAALVVTGTIDDGQTGTLAYSIAGYTEAAKRINTLCKATAAYLYGQN